MHGAASPKSRCLAALGAAATVLLSTPLHAHHSFAMYDQTKQVTHTGRLIRFIPGANHAQLLFEIVGDDGKPAVGADGKPITWGVELGPVEAIGNAGTSGQRSRNRALPSRASRSAPSSP